MRVELTHDLLAKKIRQASFEKNRDFLHAKKIMDTKYDLYNSNPKILLSDIELNTVNPHLEKLILSNEQINFYRLSQKNYEKTAFLSYLRNIINIGSVFVILALMVIITQHRKSHKRYEQNIQFANLLNDLLDDIGHIKSGQDLAKLKENIINFRNNIFNTPQLSEFFKEDTKEVEQIKHRLKPFNDQTRKSSTFYTIKGKVVDIHNKGISNARITLIEKGIITTSDEGGYFQLDLENSIFAPDIPSTLVIEARLSHKVEITNLNKKIDTQENSTFIDLDRIMLYPGKIIELE